MTSHRRWEDFLDERLQDPARALGYLNACLEEGDPEAFLLALRDVARARGGIEKRTADSALDPEVLDRIRSDSSRVDLQRLEPILDALGFRLSITLKEAG